MTEPTASAIAERPPFWATVREALRGSERDYTQGAIGSAIVLLAVPMVLEMALESVFALTDIFFVAKLGPAAVATVGLTESLLAVVYALAMGLSTAVTAVVARRIGEKDPAGAGRAAGQGILFGIIVAVVLGATGAFFARPLLMLLGADAEVIAIGLPFARIMLGGEVSIILLFIANAAFRGAGDAAIAMRVLWLANAINIVLGPLLIFGVGPLPELGVTGAAIATTGGRAVGASVALWRLSRPGARLHVTVADLRPDWPVIGQLLRLSGNATLQFLIGTASWIGLVRIMAQFGSAAIAGYTIALRVVVFALLPSWGLSNAAATMVGQGLGAKLPERAEKSVWVASRYNLYFLTAIGALFFVAAVPIVNAFTADPVVRAFAVDALRIVALGFPFYAYGMVVSQSFNGAGDTWTPTWLNFFAFWVFEIPFAWWVAVSLGAGPRGVFVAIALAFSLLAVAAAMVFRRGRWKTVRV